MQVMPADLPGTGAIHLLPSGAFAHLSYSYPLKLQSPIPAPSSLRGLRVVYVLSYGGGLVSGDRVWISVLVEADASLVVLTQGTTKVFKRRPRGRLSSLAHPSPALRADPSPHRLDTTTQTLITRLLPRAALYLLPSPTVCFSRSRYTQRQRFELPTEGTATLVLLDWFTSGREKCATGTEEWDAERMEFYAEVWWGEKRGVGERIVLEDEKKTSSGPPAASQQRTSYSSSLLPYTIYLTLLLTGPLVQTLLDHLLRLQADEPKLVHHARRPPFLWSLSLLEHRNVPGMGRSAMVRACAVDGEKLRDWLHETLKEGMSERLGAELWERAMG